MGKSSFSRRYPRLVLPALPQLDVTGFWAAFWRPRRADVLAALAPVLGVLLLIGGALLALEQHAGYRAEVRRAETGRYLAEFREPPVAGAWQRLSAVWQAEWGRQHRLLERVAVASGPGFTQAVRNYRDFVVGTVEDHRLTQDVETVREFFVRLGVCIRIGSCDPSAAAAQLGPAVWQFRNQHYYYFAQEGLAADFDRSVVLIAPPARPDPAA